MGMDNNKWEISVHIKIYRLLYIAIPLAMQSLPENLFLYTSTNSLHNWGKNRTFYTEAPQSPQKQTTKHITIKAPPQLSCSSNQLAKTTTKLRSSQ